MNEELKEQEVTKELFVNYSSEISRIKQEGLTSEVIDKIISKHEPKRAHMKKLYDRYCTERDGVPVFKRKARADVVNNKLNNDYFSEIIDTKVGYFAGSPFTYTYSQIDKDKGETNKIQHKGILSTLRGMFTKANNKPTVVTNADIDRNTDLLKHFILYSNTADTDVELTKFAEICGYGSRLMYVDTDGQETAMFLNPWDCVHLTKTDITEPEYGMIIHDDIEVYRNGSYETVTKIEFYDEKNIYFKEKGADGWIDDPDATKPVMEHLFDYCPLQGIPNNNEMMGGAEKVLTLIDAVDRALSDCNSEIEAFKLAYMIIAGGSIDEEELQKARDNGCFAIPIEGVKIDYLTKEINDTFIENHLNRLDKAIYKFSKTPDLSNSDFANTTSGIAMKFKLFALETRCMVFERKYEKANRYMFKVLASAWKKKNINFDPLEAITTFKRTMPLDLSYEADILEKLDGKVSKQTALSLVSFVDDPEYELDLIQQEQEEGLGINWDKDDSEDKDITKSGEGAIPNTEIKGNEGTENKEGIE